MKILCKSIFVVLILMLSACNPLIEDDPRYWSPWLTKSNNVNGTGSSGSSDLIFQNNSGFIMTQIQVSEDTSTSWGTNRLSSNLLDTKTFTITNLACGKTYDIRFIPEKQYFNSDSYLNYELRGVVVTCGENTTINIRHLGN